MNSQNPCPSRMGILVVMMATEMLMSSTSADGWVNSPNRTNDPASASSLLHLRLLHQQVVARQTPRLHHHGLKVKTLAQKELLAQYLLRSRRTLVSTCSCYWFISCLTSPQLDWATAVGRWLNLRTAAPVWKEWRTWALSKIATPK